MNTTEASKICFGCKEEKLYSAYTLYKGKPNGRCKTCNAKRVAENRRDSGYTPSYKRSKPLVHTKDGVYKECSSCNQLLLIELFYKSPESKGGVASSCKKCQTVALSSNKERQTRNKLAKKACSIRHREKYIAASRLSTFKRKSKIEASCDGTATAAFIKSIYALEVCYYCKGFVLRKDRTLEHKNPLSRGGMHSADNITMACRSCNIIKRQKTEDEYAQYLTLIQS